MAHSMAHAIYFSFKCTSGQLNSKDFRRVMTRATQKEQATTTLQKEIIHIFRTFYQRNLRLQSFGSKSVGITFTIQFFQVQLDWSHRNLSLPIEHLFWIRFRRSAKLSGFHLFCVNLLVHDLRFAL